MKELVEEEVAKNEEKQHMLELQTRHAQMGEMIALITHQWKQPLSVIQTVCANLKLKYELDKLSPTFFMDKIDNILNQTRYMNTTVVDFQKFFTPSKAKSTFNLNENINTLLGLVATDYVHAHITVEVEEDEEVWIEGYPNEYNQVILSLLQNAKEAFLANPSKSMQIRIRISKKEGQSHVSIADNAGGISPTVLPKIFNQYESSKANGSGLGLYIAKSVIEGNMGGKIWAENSEEGAVFHIVI
jgi:signal transduction histidine kinase